MKRSGWAASVTGAAFLCSSFAADALIVYSSPGFASSIGCGLSCESAISDFAWGARSNEIAEQFVLKTDVAIDGISWVGTAEGAANFTVNFFNTRVDGLPAVTPFASFGLGSSFNQFSVGPIANLFSADLAALRLHADVPYYVSVVANSLRDELAWGWMAGNEGARRIQRQRPADWQVVLPDFERQSFGFILNGSASIPEPGTLALFMIGIAGAGFASRRKTGRKTA